MHKSWCIILSLTVVALLSCKKKAASPAPEETALPEAPEKLDTVKPLPYFPVYPGSYWKYSDGITKKASATYQKDSYTISLNDPTRPQSNFSNASGTFYVPFYENQAIWGYRKHAEGAIYTKGVYPTEPLIRIVSDSLPVGVGWMTSYASHRGTFDQIVAVDTTINILGKDYYPTIVVCSFLVDNGGPPIPDKRTYYTRDIGIVKLESLNNFTGVVFKEVHVVEYFINR